MTFALVKPEPLEVITRTAQVDGAGNPLTDDYGQPLPPVETTTATFGRISRPANQRGTEVVVGQDTTIAEYKAVLAAGVSITRTSRVRQVATGRVFDVVGDPYRPLDAEASAEHHVEVHLKAVTR